jgi:hypothetical protein
MFIFVRMWCAWVSLSVLYVVCMGVTVYCMCSLAMPPPTSLSLPRPPVLCSCYLAALFMHVFPPLMVDATLLGLLPRVVTHTNTHTDERPEGEAVGEPCDRCSFCSCGDEGCCKAWGYTCTLCEAEPEPELWSCVRVYGSCMHKVHASGLI